MRYWNTKFPTNSTGLHLWTSRSAWWSAPQWDGQQLWQTLQGIPGWTERTGKDVLSAYGKVILYVCIEVLKSMVFRWHRLQRNQSFLLLLDAWKESQLWWWTSPNQWKKVGMCRFIVLNCSHPTVTEWISSLLFFKQTQLRQRKYLIMRWRQSVHR